VELGAGFFTKLTFYNLIIVGFDSEVDYVGRAITAKRYSFTARNLTPQQVKRFDVRPIFFTINVDPTSEGKRKITQTGPNENLAAHELPLTFNANFT